ncbi:metalloprotease mig-17-like isoform X2 [Littorina saxatilis]|uniref:metalloprotease mig-17-like isoform X2 n=1 Tax=Littorina saxatilis TaxID=31220 RepID=UPI0038B57285
MYRCMFSVFPYAVLLLYNLGRASAKPAVKQGQGFQSRPGSQFSTLALDVNLDGSIVHLDLDQDLDQDTHIPLYELYTDDRGKAQARKMLTETSVSFYQNQQHDSTFGIVSKRNRNGTVSTTMQGFIIRGEKLYEARSKSHEESAGEASQVKNNSLLFDLDLQEVTQPQQQIDVDYESAEPSVRGTTVEDGSYIHGLRQKRQTVTQDVTIDVVAVVDYGIYFKWYNNSNETSEDEKKQDALDFIYQFHAFVFNGVNLRYKSIGDALPYTIHVKLSAIVVATRAEDSPWTETRRQNDSDGRVDTADGYAALRDFRDWAKNTTTLPGYDHLMLFTGYNLTNASGADTMQGLAYVGTVCDIRRWSATSIAEELKDLNTVIGTSTHELGHGLSALHDGQSGVCNDDDNYIMSGSGKRPGTIAKQLNDWKFSNCSIKYFDDYIKQNLDSSEERKCFYTSYNASGEVKDTSTLMPGQVYDTDEQCQQIYGQSSYLCNGVPNWNLSMVCLNMWCSLGGGRCRRQVAARGTTCGDGMMVVSASVLPLFCS